MVAPEIIDYVTHVILVRAQWYVALINVYCNWMAVPYLYSYTVCTANE